MLPQPTTSNDERSASGWIAKRALNIGSIGYLGDISLLVSIASTFSSYRGHLAAFGSLKYSPESSWSRLVLSDGDHSGGDPKYITLLIFSLLINEEYIPGTRIIGCFGRSNQLYDVRYLHLSIFGDVSAFRRSEKLITFINLPEA